MTSQDQAPQDPAATAARRGKRKKFDKTAPMDPTEALEGMLINAHRIAMTLNDLAIFRDSELSVAEWAILKSLGDRRDVPLKEISSAAGISRQRLRKLMSELQTKDLVSLGKPQDDDKRTRMISATPLGVEVLAVISLKMKGLFPDTGKGAGGTKRGRSLVVAARTMDRVAKSMRRSGRPKKAEGKGAKPGADDGDDD